MILSGRLCLVGFPTLVPARHVLLALLCHHLLHGHLSGAVLSSLDLLHVELLSLLQKLLSLVFQLQTTIQCQSYRYIRFHFSI